jgi:hypothetical protein
MLVHPKVENGVVYLECYSGWGPGNHVRLIGSTFPIVPCGTFVEKMCFAAQEGLHAMLFFSRVDGPHRMGSGKTAYLDSAPKLGSSMLLMWREGEKVVAKTDGMSPTELSQFNPFVRSGTSIVVADANRKIVYVAGTDWGPLDPEWAYKKVSGNAMCEYIAKRRSLEELDAATEEEIRSRNELEELRLELRTVGTNLRILEEHKKRNDWALQVFASYVKQVVTGRFYSNRIVGFVARMFGNDGSSLQRIVADSGPYMIDTDKIAQAVFNEQNR